MSDAFEISVVNIKEENASDSKPWGILQEVDSPPLGDEKCDMPQQRSALSEVKLEIEIDIERDPLEYVQEQALLGLSDSKEIPTSLQLTPKVEASLIKQEELILSSSSALADHASSAHVQSGAKKPAFKCNMCIGTFESKKKLALHFKRNHKYCFGMPSGQYLKCDQCEYTCNKMNILKRHLRTHKAEKRFQCDQCDYSCQTRRSLQYHLAVHTGEKPFKCDQCDNRFVLRSLLKHHLVIAHLGEKPFKCDQCAYRSISKSHLNDHIRTHTGEKPFKCHLCEHSCTQRSTLNEHLRRHTGEKPYKCNQCDYTSINNSSLKIHLSRHTGDKPFKCDQCEYRCNQSGTLKRHLKTHTRATKGK